ncbi:MAG: glycine cleavage system protein GcvH [Candidatus Omnitrophica bacterium]|nr:glycine cleavage system protein GcvH [Candidatus Omnitrophota bacterium]
MIPRELKYTKEHEWVKIDGKEAVFGITEHAQSELGDITFVELPSKGSDVKKTDVLGTIESVKAASEIYAPLSGKISEVNELLSDKPETINFSPYADGWICKINTNDESEIETLMDAASYEKYVKE